MLLGFDLPLFDTGVDTPAEAAIAVLVAVYGIAAWFNTRIPDTGVALKSMRTDPAHGLLINLARLLPDFWSCNKRLWQDKLGQISLAATTLIWGVAGNLRFIVFAWAAAALRSSSASWT